MQLFTIALSVHIVTAAIIGLGLAADWLSIWQLRASNTGRRALGWLGLAACAKYLTLASAVTLFGTGLYLSAVLLHAKSLDAGWIVMSVFAISILIVAGIDDERQVRACRATLRSVTGPLPKVLQRSLRDLIFVRYLYISTCLCLSLIALMLFRPPFFVAAAVVIAPCSVGFLGIRLQAGSERKRLLNEMTTRLTER